MSDSCGNPAADSDALMTRRPKYDKSKRCVKCKERQGNIVIRHAVYCKTCFFPLIETRFRKTLVLTINAKIDGPRKKAIKAGGSLVIGFSGGVGSTVLLDLVAKSYFNTGDESRPTAGGTAHPRNQTGDEFKIWNGRPAVCYVELSSVIPGAPDRIEEARKTVETYSTNGVPEFDFIPLKIEDAFNNEWWSSVGGKDLASAARSVGIDITDESLPVSDIPSSSATSTPLLALQSYIASLPTQTAKESAVQTLTRLLLLYTAASRSASHLLLGTSLTTLSVNLISGITQGAGFSVAEEAYEEWTYPGSVAPKVADTPTSNTQSKKRTKAPSRIRIVRPLRDIGMKECAFWMWWSKLTVSGKKRLSSGRQSIVSLTRDFIMGLEQDFPSTVSTIARTCAKVTPKEKSQSTCLLCERPSEPQAQEWKARISIRAYTDKSSVEFGDPLPPHLTELPHDTNPTHDQLPVLASRLCYACHTTLTSRGSKANSGHRPRDIPMSVIPTPAWVQATLREDILVCRKVGEEDMKAHIKDFLLDE